MTENPFREGGSYHAIIETLRRLRMGKMHPAAKVVETYREVVGPAAWKVFSAKEARNEKTHKDAAGRVIANCLVLTRPDYGTPARAAGMEVRKDRNKDGYMFGLYAIKPVIQKPKAKLATDQRKKRTVKSEEPRKPKKAAKKKPKTAPMVSKAKSLKVVKGSAPATAPEAGTNENAAQN